MQRIKVLDSMRGLAAAVVLFHHVFTRFPDLFVHHFQGWILNIFLIISDLNVQAVLFFFFLSGFSICLSVKNGLPVTKTTFNKYTYRRLKRIMPLYYFAIAITFFCGWITNAVAVSADFSVNNLFGNIFFLQCSKSYSGNWFAPYGDNGPLWSLSFEMFYYFLLPVFLLLIFKFYKTDKLTPAVNRAALIASFFLSIICIMLNQIFFFPFIAFGGLFYIWYAGFFIALVYLHQNILVDKNFFLLLLLSFVLGTMNYINPSATLSKLLFGSVIAASFFVLYRLRKALPISVLVIIENGFNFLFYTIGTGSYALYLLHYPVLMMLKKYEHLTGWQMLASIILLTVFCIWLERFFVRKKWLFLRLQYLK